MNPVITAGSRILAILTLLTDIAIILFLTLVVLSLAIPVLKQLKTTLIRDVKPVARPLAFLVALTAMLGSLFYSDVAGYTPCILCWYQRILMYPQTLLIAMGIVKKDRDVADYAIGFSLVGGLISAYHYYIQVGGSEIIPCSAIGHSVSCSQNFSMQYGYITIPMMALSAFAAIIILMRISKHR